MGLSEVDMGLIRNFIARVRGTRTVEQLEKLGLSAPMTSMSSATARP